METNNWMRNRMANFVVVATVMLGAATALADDGAASPANTNQSDSAGEEAEFWIGIMGVPTDELLKMHLKIKDGLVVQAVVPDSPAAKAELKQYDILLKFNGTAIENLASLAGAISENGDAEASLTIIRAGKQRNLKITPAVRPADAVVDLPVAPHGNLRSAIEWLNKLNSGQMGQEPFHMWFVQPGIVLPKDLPEELRRFGVDIGPKPRWLTSLPEGTSITITKAGEGPAQIVVKRGDETWTVDEDQLDQLPEDLRDAVGDLLESGSRVTIRTGEGPRLQFRDVRPSPVRPKLNLRKRLAQPEDGEDNDDTGAGRLNKRLEDLHQKLRENQQRLEQEMEKLRRDLEHQDQDQDEV